MGQPPGRPERLFAELGRWRDKAAKRGKATAFTSDIIPDWLNTEIVAAQEAVGPEAAFSFLKQVPLSVRMRAERAIRDKVQAILGKYQSRAARAIRNGDEFDYTGLADELRAAVLPELSSLVVDNVLRTSVETGISFDPSIINQEALRWAREFSTSWAQGLTETTRKQLQEAMAAFIQTPGMTIGDVTSLIEPAFGPVRAEMIAATEVTRAYSMATNNTQEMMGREVPDLVTTRVNNTMQDELVCQICGPLEGAPESEWPDPSGPPWHPRCRCSSSIRFDTPEQLAAEFTARQTAREDWMREQGLWREPAGAEVPQARPSNLEHNPTGQARSAALAYTQDWIQRTAEWDKMAPEEVIRRVNDRLAEDLQRPISIRRGNRGAMDILTSGRFKTQYETGTSAGSFMPDGRAEAEAFGLGYATDTAAHQRPVYGYLATDRNGAFTYGRVEFRLKPEVRERSTVTIGDSLSPFLGEQLVGTPLSDPGQEGWDGSNMRNYMRNGTMPVMQGGCGYLEVQIQGGVGLADIERIIVHSPAIGGWDELAELAKQRGLLIEFNEDS